MSFDVISFCYGVTIKDNLDYLHLLLILDTSLEERTLLAPSEIVGDIESHLPSAYSTFKWVVQKNGWSDHGIVHVPDCSKSFHTIGWTEISDELYLPPPLYIRYADDTFAAVKSAIKEGLFQTLNMQFSSFQFTRKAQNANRVVSFLGCRLKVSDFRKFNTKTDGKFPG